MTEYTFTTLVVWASSIMILGSISTAVICSLVHKWFLPKHCTACNKFLKKVAKREKKKTK